MATTTSQDPEAIRSELGRALRRHRRYCPPMETARLLLSADGPGQRLVGLRYDGGRAAYFDERGGRVIAAFFGADGLDPRGGRPIATLQARGSVGDWADRMRYYWAWRHPRFR